MVLQTGEHWPVISVILLLATTAVTFTSGQASESSTPVTLIGDTIVQRMMEHNQERSGRLRRSTSERHYEVEYRGVPRNLAASMDVIATYDAPSSKSFRIISESGSKILLDRVLKKLLESEEEAARHGDANALNPANYSFRLVDEETAAGEPLYVFQVEPHAESKFLYRGRIWVDAHDYAVTRIEAEPAKNPSFWIKKTEIHHTYKQTGGFWLPERNRSETKVRFGGSAVLTIDYGDYQIASVNAHESSAGSE